MKPFFSNNATDLLTSLLKIDPNERMSDPDSIKNHAFFEEIDWEALERREIKPPVRPKVTGKKDVRNFDPYFIYETPQDTPVDSKLDEAAKAEHRYDGFTYLDKTQI